MNSAAVWEKGASAQRPSWDTPRSAVQVDKGAVEEEEAAVDSVS